MLLDSHGSDLLVIDVVRVAVVTYGVLATGWSLGRLVIFGEGGETCREGRAIYLALLVAWLPIWLTEAQQIGRPWLYFRLPLAVALIPATWWVSREHRRRHHLPARRVDAWWWPVSVLGSRDGRAGQPRRSVVTTRRTGE